MRRILLTLGLLVAAGSVGTQGSELGAPCEKQSDCTYPQKCVSWMGPAKVLGCSCAKVYRSCEILCTDNSDCPTNHGCWTMENHAHGMTGPRCVRHHR
jgi:hypothetical protein